MSKYRIMVAEDDLDFQNFLSASLQDDYELLLVNNGREALAKFAQTEPDLCLLDVKMPEMDGYEVTKRLRANPATKDLPVIMISVLSEQKYFKHGYACGANLFLSKPLDPDRLKKVLQLELQKTKKAPRPKRHTLAECANLHVGQRRVLVLDDDPDMLNVLQAMLEQDFEVVTARNPLVALELIEGIEPDLMLVDILMPELSGWNFVPKVRAKPFLKGVPAIYITGMEKSASIKLSPKVGQDLQLTKPLDPDQLPKIIKQQIVQSKLPYRGKTHSAEKIMRHLQSQEAAHQKAVEKKKASQQSTAAPEKVAQKTPVSQQSTAAPEVAPPPVQPAAPKQAPLPVQPAAPEQAPPPVMEEAPVLLPDIAATKKARAQQKARVMIIDSDKVLQKKLLNSFRRSYEVIAYPRSRHVVDKAEEWLPDIIILNWVSTKETGYNLMELLRDNRHFVKTPVIITAEKPAWRDRRQIKKSDSSAYLPKPYRIAKLSDTLIKIVNSPAFKIRQDRPPFEKLKNAKEKKPGEPEEIVDRVDWRS